MNCVLLFVTPLQQGFFVSVAKLMRDNYRLVFIASAGDVRDVILTYFPDAEVVLRTRPSEPAPVTLAEVCRLETVYGETFSSLISKDRALGHGYIFNADAYPLTHRGNWDTNQKHAYLAEEFGFYEDLCNRFKPTLALTIAIHEVQYLVFTKMHVSIFALGLIKYGSRLFWYQSPKYDSGRLRNKLAEVLAKGTSLDNCDPPTYTVEKSAHTINSMLSFSWYQTLKDATYQIVRDILRLTGLRPKKGNSYFFAAWLPVILRKAFLYRYFQKCGVVPKELEGKRIIFLPLHVEPEIALLSVSPEFNNSMEMIAWISKAAPADCTIVVKEHLTCLGHRSRAYYERLRSLPNVCFAQLNVSSWQWIKSASVVATITGTVGTEAVYFDKPVLSFGVHQLINDLPTVRFADCYASTRRALIELLTIEKREPIFHRGKVALHEALMAESFEFPGFEKSWKKIVIDLPGALMALRNLRDQTNTLSDFEG